MRLLDLFCGAGGAAMGYARAGFTVVGVDIEPQPNYPFEFFQADVMKLTSGAEPEDFSYFDVIHASPPCQAYAPVTAWRGNQADHPDLFAPTRDRLIASGLPWVIENVPFAPFEPDVVLCGSQFGLPIRRHRWFLFGQPAFQLMPPCQHRSTDHAFDHGGKTTETEYRAAMGCDWMTVKESRNAIPPAYTEWVGAQLMATLRAAA
jgi:DNA (cytosine-5)-methyltransferase 1